MRKLLIFILVLIFTITPVYAETLGQATSGENGLSGNTAGDQSGKEVALCNWYGGWKYVFRAKDPDTAKIIAETMKAACANNHIGYDMEDRLTLYDRAYEQDWDVSKITTNCETTCVDLVAVCLNAAGINAPRGWSSKSVYNTLMPTGLFECFTSTDYVSSPEKLLPGDILCAPDKPHTAMVVESRNKLQFKVIYKNTEGKTRTVRIEEGDTIILNPNNQEELENIEVNNSINLKNYTPEKPGGTFIGWKKNKSNFSAQYNMRYAPIMTGNKPKKIN